MENDFARIALESALKAILILVIALMSAFQLLAKPPDQPTEIRVQIMDSKTHRPLKGRRVQIMFSAMDGQWYPDAPSIVGRTGSDGIAVFELKKPIPPWMDVLDLQAYPCSDEENFSTQAILNDGAVSGWSHSGIKKADKWCTADSQASQPQKQPGKVVFLIHPLNWFQYVWYDAHI